MSDSYIINWPLLGVVRFFLAFVVLTEHLGWVMNEDPVLKISKFSPLVAVLAFLVISGFSIAASYQAESRGFYLRRILRIFPIYILSILIAEGVVFFIHEGGAVYLRRDYSLDYEQIIGNIIFMQGFFIRSIEANPIVWTLSIEVLFYALTPFIEKYRKWLLPVIILSSLLFMSQRYLGYIYYSQMLYGVGVLFLAWAWLLGYWFFHHRHFSVGIFFVTSLGILNVTINGYFINDFWTLTWLISCISLCFGGFICMPFSGFMKTFGDVSYPMYLLHVPVFKTLSKLSLPNIGIVYIASVILFSWLVDRLYDQPIKAYIKRKFFDGF